VSARLAGDRKLSMERLKAKPTIRRRMTGMAV